MDKTLKTFASEIHKQRRKTFERRKVVAAHADEIWGIDLAQMDSYVSDNDGFKFIMCIIDVFSKYAWCVPLKTKSSLSILNALKEVVSKSDRIPEKIWTDEGTEFKNKDMFAWCKANGITLYSTYGDSKSVVAERFIRTIKTKIQTQMTETKNKNWVKILQELVKNYNNTKHSTIKMTPIEASKPENELPVAEIFMKKPKSKTKKIQFAIGDKVRISNIKQTFAKGYEANWSFEVFTVDQVLKTVPVTYKLIDFNNDPITGSFYDQELQKTTVPEHYEVEKILETRKVGKKKQHLIKYLGWPSKFNQWIDESQITEIKK